MKPARIPEYSDFFRVHGIDPQKVAMSPAIGVDTFNDLRGEVAKLACERINYILFYRGQAKDYGYVENERNSSFYPSIYRGIITEKIGVFRNLE